MEIPDDMLEALRGRRGVEEDDATQDERIKALSPEQIVRECTAWHLGDSGWASTICRWINSVNANTELI